MNDNSHVSGISFSTLLFTVFLILKLCNVIDWSWWWVTSPLWISVIGYVLLLGVFLLYYALEDRITFNRLQKWKKSNKEKKK